MNAPRRLIHALALAGLVLAGGAAGSLAQLPMTVPPELYNDTRPIEETRLRFCLVEEDSLTADFERAMAEEIAAALLLEAVMVPVPSPMRRVSLDYVLPYSLEEIFLYLVEDCDAFMGFIPAPNQYPDWITFTRPYMRTGFSLLVAADAPYQSLEDIPRDLAIGTRTLSQADRRFATFVAVRSEADRWRRFPYQHNGQLLDNLVEGTIGAAIVWETAARMWIAEGKPVRIIPSGSFMMPHVDFSIVIRVNNPFLRVMLDDSIAALIRDGTAEEILATFPVPGISIPPAE